MPLLSPPPSSRPPPPQVDQENAWFRNQPPAPIAQPGEPTTRLGTWMEVFSPVHASVVAPADARKPIRLTTKSTQRTPPPPWFTRLHRVLPSPLASCLFVFRTVRLVYVCDLGHQGVVGVRVCQHRADREEDWKAQLEISVCGRLLSRLSAYPSIWSRPGSTDHAGCLSKCCHLR